MISTETKQNGVTGYMPSSTKPHLFIFGGHSGKGMVMATEMANGSRTSAVTTVSKRGKPAAPGPATAFAQAMSQETVHYMAACDEKDAKAVECLMDWQAPSRTAAPAMDGGLDLAQVMEKIKKEMDSMNSVQLERALETAEGCKLIVVRNQRQIKARTQRSDCSPEEKKKLQDTKLDYEEKEASFMELTADLQQKLSAQPKGAEQVESNVEKLLKQMEKELALQKGF
eukprot:CAMPEP_0197658482 /NCGR_PEP_ID=MMETSP1338-20131121/45266_1 /TAXON_ID=43686 ORGANISM="Pelagodinium beii, Strain RCC1491" /NCGR_SAMPLE_ID=MMETSP1338 /ASSEMBLY_ACC=CAM_ASM_000754 /LENGTH=226 /DNA_ID=CAMNT_0043235079 /DNA_START=89 /DNA_END=769 /DNA_ORIENTATION=+